MRGWAALLLAAGLPAAAAAADVRLNGAPGVLFTAGHVLGELVAVLTVAERGSFLGAVQPPLLMVAAVAAAGAAGAPATGSATLVDLGARVIQEFPLTLAVTVAAVVLALFRAWRFRRRRALAAH